MAYELIQVAEAEESLSQFCDWVSFLLILVPVSSLQDECSTAAGKDTAEAHDEGQET